MFTSFYSGYRGSRADTIRKDALEGKIYSSDLDTSTLALTPEENGSVVEQQRPNFESAVKLTIFARLLEHIYGLPSIALNGEVGEVGTEVVTTEELTAYLAGYRSTLDEFMALKPDAQLEWIDDNNGIFGFSDEEMSRVKQVVNNEAVKFHDLEAMSCQVGTKHGGVKVKGKPWKRTGDPVVNMKRLEELADICRMYGLAGLILHGASSISEEELAEAVKRGAIAVHLATYIHDRIFSHPEFPTELVSKLFALLRLRNPKLLVKQIDDYTPNVMIGDIVGEIDKTIEDGKPLSDEQREQVAWIVHTARGKGTSKEQHDKGEGVWSFIDLEKDMMALPKETLAQLNKVVEEQVTRYVELLNAKDTGKIIENEKFPTPPRTPMPDALKGYISSPPESRVSREEAEIIKMEPTASKAGLEMPTHLKTRYTFLLCEGFFKDGELRNHQNDNRFKDRFEIDSISGSTSDQLIGNILSKTKDPNRTVALVPKYLSADQLKILTDKGIRFVRTNTPVLLAARNSNDPNREQFQLDTYATMFAVRRMDGKVKKESSVYRTLSFYIRSHFDLNEDIEVEEYIQAVVDGTVDTLIKGYLAYRPAEPYDTPTYGTIAAALISA
ncbi:MAG: class II fructose-bisphosphate aldolase [Candidatus Omnitrophica bacterium]|nr:class II fructose-bisphosphate aldolase [Candidatus Omnitrophota bacterium]